MIDGIDTEQLFEDNDSDYQVRLRFRDPDEPPQTRERWVLLIDEDPGFTGLWWVAGEEFTWVGTAWVRVGLVLQAVDVSPRSFPGSVRLYELEELAGSRLLIGGSRPSSVVIHGLTGSWSNELAPPLVVLGPGAQHAYNWREVVGIDLYSGGR